jgi:hypothetical protein
MEPATIVIDLAKRVFQVHFIEPDTGTIHRKVLKRASSNRSSPIVPDAGLSWKPAEAPITGPDGPQLAPHWRAGSGSPPGDRRDSGPIRIALIATTLA